MKRISFKMKLKEGYVEEYKKRHDNIWPELKILLKIAGIQEYSIFLNPETLDLFAYLKVSEDNNLKDLPSNNLMKKWWYYMADIMEVNDDTSPKQTELVETFYLK